jgi:hypothetical protein
MAAQTNQDAPALPPPCFLAPHTLLVNTTNPSYLDKVPFRMRKTFL